jgi:hypothetical protein
VELWRIENFELAPVPEETHGLFFGGDSYVLKYTYTERNREKYIIYYWQVCFNLGSNKKPFQNHYIFVTKYFYYAKCVDHIVGKGQFSR